MTTLVIAPHPDDEILGCGGVMAKRAKAGDDVWVCIVSEGRTPDYSEEFIENERKETYSAHKQIGVGHLIRLSLPTARLDTIPQRKLNYALKEVVDVVRPDEVFVPHRGDIHKDHQIVADAAMVALRPKDGIKPARILAYEVMSETGWDMQNADTIFIPNVYVDITDTCEEKLNAMEAYASQLQPEPNARSLAAIEGLARFRGATIGVTYAEAFSLIRGVEI